MKSKIFLGLLVLSFYSSCDKEVAPVGIFSFSPTSGDYNSNVTITGSNFGNLGNTSVTLGLNELKVVSVSPTEIVATIPAGAATDKITVTSNGQTTVTTFPFNVTAGSWQPAGSIYQPANNQSVVAFSVGGLGFTQVAAGSKGLAQLHVFGDYWDAYGIRKPLNPGFVATAATAFGTNTKGYILQFQKLWEYDPDFDTWTEKTAPPDFVVTGDVMCGCYIHSTGNIVMLDLRGTMITYHPQDDSWTKDDNNLAPFAPFISKSEVQICRSTEGKAYFKSGSNIWEWTASNNTWRLLPEFPGKLTPNYGFTVQDDVYMGVSEKDFLWVFKPNLNVWIQKAGIAVRPRVNAVSFTVNNAGYFGFGTDALYDWNTMQDMNIYVPGN